MHITFPIIHVPSSYPVIICQLAGETYRKTDSEFLDAERNSRTDDGSTASTAVLVGDHLYVANVGDSRAIISKAGKGKLFGDSVLLR